MSQTRTVEVDPEHDGARLDNFLTAVLPEQSRSQLQRLIKDGRVTGAGEALRPSTAVRAGQHYSIDIPAPTAARPEPEALPLRILFEDPDVVVLDKPAGMVVHPAAGHTSGTLVNALLHHITDLSGIGGELRPGIVHRLDRGTSGLMVVAKHDRAHQELSRQFRDREVEKEYVALVWGVVHAGRRIDAPIGRDEKDRQKMSTRARRARSAVTRVTWAAPLQGRVAAEGGDRHGPDASDSRAPERDRPSDRGRCRLRRRSSPRPAGPARRDAPRAAVPPRGTALLHPSDRRPARRVRLAASAGPRVGRSTSRAKRQEGHCRIDRSTNVRGRCRANGSSTAKSSTSIAIACGCRTGARSPWTSSAIRVRSCCCRCPSRGHIVLIRQYRYAVNRWLWELPAGSVDPGEEPEAAARRECHEEIGLVPDTIVRLGGVPADAGLLQRGDGVLPAVRPDGPRRSRRA